MINLKNTVIVVLTFIMVMLFSITAMAATLNEATYDNSKITVSGSCTNGNKVQVVVFDYNNQPLYLSTIDVVGNSFSKTLDAIFNFEAGKAYTVRIADYNGKNASQKPLHTHSFAGELKFDDANHWLECLCGAKSDITAHTFSEQKSDDTNHWLECSCGAKSDITAHTYGEWTITKDATETEDGSKECTCSVCGYTETAVIEATGASPETSDNGNLMLWIALLIISGGIITTLCVAMKKRRKQ